MGCAQSRIDNEESVARCKERRLLMRSAVSSRNAFAAAHSAYTVSLKSTGAALSDFANADPLDSLPHDPSLPPSSSPGPPPPPPLPPSAIPIDNPPPPPPPPSLSDFSSAPLHRSVSMPDLPGSLPKKPPSDPPTIFEDGEPDADDAPDSIPVDPSPPPPPPPREPSPFPDPPPPVPEPNSAWEYFFSVDQNIPRPSLAPDTEDFPSVKEEIQEEVNEKKKAPVVVEAEDPPAMMTPEKVAEEPLPAPAPPVQKVLKKVKQGGTGHSQLNASSVGAVTEVKRVGQLSLAKILNELDDHFLKAFQSAHEVSKMLEATRMHYHSNFADNRGHIDHSARVMRVITWNRSFKGMPNTVEGKDDFDNDEHETHATVLDKMLAWEKKLYDEVKAAEHMKIDYQRKVAALNKQKKRGTNPEALERAKAAVSHLHTRYIVDMQSLDSTVSEINHLRDDQLYPKLVQLVDGMKTMWEAMHRHHGSQNKIAMQLKDLDILSAPNDTSEQHYRRTNQLCLVVREWHSQLQKLMAHQREYIQALNSWLRLNLIPIESSLKEKVSSPPKVFHPPIQPFLQAWHDQLEKVPDELARTAIFSFSEAINSIWLLQQEELKLRERCEDLQKDYLRKMQGFEDWCQKNAMKTPASAADEADLETGEGPVQNDPVAERKLMLEQLKARLNGELEAHRKLCEQVSQKSLRSLKTHLPVLFRSMSEFALSCAKMYQALGVVAQSRESNV
ncbi:hypothetical protein DsansV1_C33g0224421 [Dioscorea sansibarensis]